MRALFLSEESIAAQTNKNMRTEKELMKAFKQLGFKFYSLRGALRVLPRKLEMRAAFQRAEIVACIDASANQHG